MRCSLFIELVLEPSLVKHVAFPILNDKEDRSFRLAIRLPPVRETRRELMQSVIDGVVGGIDELGRDSKVPLSRSREVPAVSAVRRLVLSVFNAHLCSSPDRWESGPKEDEMVLNSTCLICSSPPSSVSCKR
jgi:hypothetical protein